ncbi:unnamed protein product [Prorocentrum cordatum]|uniref:Scaffold protein Nfu/NifU N-terminal domain-containing protein n=1 Tax=Prorocentrum cordatum TaxID=2364126 RepID=A0ABN9SE46_9DINO|nr:unnamed protein product [Polarella glacialis]
MTTRQRRGGPGTKFRIKFQEMLDHVNCSVAPVAGLEGGMYIDYRQFKRSFIQIGTWLEPAVIVGGQGRDCWMSQSGFTILVAFKHVRPISNKETWWPGTDDQHGETINQLRRVEDSVNPDAEMEFEDLRGKNHLRLELKMSSSPTLKLSSQRQQQQHLTPDLEKTLKLKELPHLRPNHTTQDIPADQMPLLLKAIEEHWEAWKIFGLAEIPPLAEPEQARQKYDNNVETTPNPKSLKFLPEGRDVLGAGSRTLLYRSRHEAGESALALALFEADGAERGGHVGRAPRHRDEGGHGRLGRAPGHRRAAHRELLRRGLESCGRGRPGADRRSGAPRPGRKARILELLDERVRPSIQQDGGDIAFERFDQADGSLYLRLQGSCSGCAQSHATLQEGVRNLFLHYIPEVKQIVGMAEEEEEEIPRPGWR